jgi:hypothetical protein
MRNAKISEIRSLFAKFRSDLFNDFAECGGMENGGIEKAKTTTNADVGQSEGTHLDKKVKCRWRFLCNFKSLMIETLLYIGNVSSWCTLRQLSICLYINLLKFLIILFRK